MASSLTTDGEAPVDLRPMPRPVAPRKRRVRERLSLGHLFMIASALLAFVLVVSLLQDRRLTTTVIAARADIAPGTVITPDLVTEVELPSESDLVASLATPEAIASGEVTAGQRIAAGDPVTLSAIASTSAPSGLRAMSLPIDRVDAVGGDISAGDRIDVISVTGAGAEYVAVSLEVLDTASQTGRSGGLASGTLSSYYVTVSVDDGTALEIALALESSKVTVVRSTGAEPVAAAERQILDSPVSTPSAGDGSSG
jgi:Flp pilus assembly protein CpaB